MLQGWKGGGSFFRAFGFPEVGAITFQDPIQRLSVPPLAGLEGQGCGAVGGRGAAGRLLSALPQPPSTFLCSAPNAFLQPHLHHWGCSGGGHLGLSCQGCCGACSTPFSRLLQPSVCCVEDLGVVASSHRPLPSQSLCGRVSISDGDHSVCAPVGASGDWMASVDLKEAYLQVPVHPASRHFLRFVFRDKVYQFKALCFGLSTAPQVFTRVMAPVSAILHSMGIRMRRYLDDWLVQSSSRESLLRDLQTVLRLCHELGIVVSPQKSNLVPSQVVQYLGVIIDTTSFRASPSQERISKLQSTAKEFRSSALPPASLWLSLLGVLSSLAHLVPGGCLRMRSLQLCLHRSWDRLDLEAPVSVSVSPRPPMVAPPSSPVFRSASLPGVSRPTLLVRRLRRGVGCPSRTSGRFRPVGLASGGVVHQRQGADCRQTGSSPVPIISKRSHGGCLLRQHHSGGASPHGGRHEVSSPQRLGSGDLALDGVPLHPPGSAVSPGLQQRPSGRPVSPSPAPPFRVVAQHDRISVFKKTLAGPNRLICHLRNHRCSIYFSPFQDPMSAGTDAFLQSWNGLQAYAFPPVAIIPRVLAKLRASSGTELTLVAPHWAQRP